MPIRPGPRGTDDSRPTPEQRGLESGAPADRGDFTVPTRRERLPYFASVDGTHIPETDLRAAIVAATVAEHAWWQGGPGGQPKLESQPDAGARIASYWTVAPGTPHTIPQTAWSAVFVSFCIRTAAQRLNVTPIPLTLAAAHFRYARAAYNKRLTATPGFYWAFDPTERPVRVGDIVVKERRQNDPPAAPLYLGLTLRDLLTRDNARTHGDIVVDVRSNQAHVIGGNVSNSVTRTTYAVGPDGRIDVNRGQNNASRVFAVLCLEPIGSAVIKVDVAGMVVPGSRRRG